MCEHFPSVAACFQKKVSVTSLAAVVLLSSRDPKVRMFHVYLQRNTFVDNIYSI